MAQGTAEDWGREFRGVTAQLASSVSVLLMLADGQPHATTVNTLTVASFEPPLMAVFVATGSRTHVYLGRGGQFTANLLTASDHALATRLARPGRAGGWDSFAPGDLVRREAAPPLLSAALAWLDCRVERVVAVGDHSLVIGAVLAMGRRPDAEPLIYYRGRFHRLGSLVSPGGHLPPDLSDLRSSW